MEFCDIYQTQNAPNILYRLMQERSHEDDSFTNISHRKLPSWDEHIAFVEREFYRFWWLIEADGQFIGSLSVTWNNEIGIVLFKRFRGRGYGKTALRTLLEMIKPLPALPSERRGGWVAHVHPKNEISVGMFGSFGFKLAQQTYVLEED